MKSKHSQPEALTYDIRVFSFLVSLVEKNTSILFQVGTGDAELSKWLIELP